MSPSWPGHLWFSNEAPVLSPPGISAGQPPDELICPKPLRREDHRFSGKWSNMNPHPWLSYGRLMRSALSFSPCWARRPWVWWVFLAQRAGDAGRELPQPQTFLLFTENAPPQHLHTRVHRLANSRAYTLAHTASRGPRGRGRHHLLLVRESLCCCCIQLL